MGLTFALIIIVLALAFVWRFSLKFVQKDSRWRTAWFCSTCNHELSNHERMYSHGTCPYCGKHNSSTIVDTVTRTYRYLPRKDKWNTNEQQVREFKETE